MIDNRMSNVDDKAWEMYNSHADFEKVDPNEFVYKG